MKLPPPSVLRACPVVVAAAAVALLPMGLRAQQVSVREDALPEAPLPALGYEAPRQAGRLVPLRGTLVDGNGDAVAGATVTMTDAAGRVAKAVSDAEGGFGFEGLSAGPARLTVQADRFASRTLALNLPVSSLSVTVTPAVVTADVQVTATQEEIGAAQLQAETRQRFFGLVPNYYVVYAGNVVPLRPKQKFALAARSVFDPVSIALNGAFAGIEQATNAFSGYGQGAQGYFKRFGAGFADSVDGTFLSGAILPVLFHQDPRYFYKGTGSAGSRALYAAEFVVRTRDDKGRWRPNYSLILGNLASGAISNAYYPASNRDGAGLTFENAFLGTAFGVVGNLVEEFVSKHLTPNLPNYNASGASAEAPALGTHR